MSYRLTDIEKWQDSWFTDLSAHAKLIFIFLCENCDNAGVYEINKRFMYFLIGITQEEFKKAIPELKKSYVKSNDQNSLFIINFLKHQKKTPLNRKNKAHQQIIKILEKNLEDETKFKGCQEMMELLPPDPNAVVEKKKESPKKETPKEEEKKPVAKRTRKKFEKPTIEDVQNYMKEKDFKLSKNEGERFWHYFESNGWKVGKNPMKNWKGACVNWMHNWYERNKVKKPNSKLDNIKEAHENLSDVDWNTVYGTTQNA